MNSRSRAICFVVVATWTVVAVPVGAEPVAVAVLNFANQARGPAGEDWNWLEKGLADLLINDLSQHPRLELVSREQMQLAILRMHHGGGLMPEWQEKISRQLKAARAVFGSYRVDGGKIRISVTVLDVLKDKPAGQALVTGMAGEVLKLEKQLAAHVLTILTDQAHAEHFVAALPVWTDSVPAAGLLYQGVDHFDCGRYEEAWLHFRRALKQDPTYADARYWAARMFYYQLRYAHAVAELEPFIQQHPKHPRTPDAVRGMLEAELMQLQTADQAVALFERLRDAVGNVEVYEPHGLYDLADTSRMPAGVWLTLRIAQAKRYLGDHWGAWVEYRHAYRLARPIHKARKSFPYTLGHIASLWNQELVDGRRIASAFPDEARVVKPPGTKFSVRTSGLDSGEYAAGRSVPWFVAPDGWLIMGVTVRAAFGPSVGESFVRIRPRGAESITFDQFDTRTSWDLLQVIRPARAVLGGASCRFDLVRGMRCVGFDIGHFTPQTKQIDIELELWPEAKTASLVVDGWPLQDYQVRIRDVGADPKRYRAILQGSHAFRADLFGDRGRGGWRPGRYLVSLINSSPHRANRPSLGRILTLRAGELTRFPPYPERLAKSAGQREKKEIQQHGRLCRCMAAARQYPAYLLPNPSPPTDDYPRAAPTGDGPRGAFVPVRSYRVARPSFVEGPAGRLFAAWHHRKDLWYSTTGDGGRSWTRPQRLPVPVNSAHRELNPQLFRDHQGRYCLVFISDRNLLRRLTPYVCTSRDLELWTRPRRLCDGECAYAFMYQDRDHQYVLIQDGRRSVWQRRSSDLRTWTGPSPVVSYPKALAMYRPHVVRGGDGQFHLLVRCIERKVMGGGKFMVASSRDGRNWPERRVLDVGSGAFINHLLAAPAPAGLLMYADYHLEDGYWPQLARFHRAADGTWWRGDKHPVPQPGSPGPALRAADGRVLFGTGRDGHAWCVELTDPAMEIQRAKQKRIEPKALSP